jgi:hypothetical protein
MNTLTECRYFFIKIYQKNSFGSASDAHNFLVCLLVTLELFRTACAIPFLALQVIAGRAQAMVAGCGSSTRGHWDGPVTYNKSHRGAAREAARKKAPCEHDASPCLGHAIVCSGCPLTILLCSLGNASASLSKINIRPKLNMGLCSVPLV